MKIFILGSNGMLGRYMYKYLSTYYETIPIDRKIYDVINDNINTLTNILKPNTVLINCIGIISQTKRDNTREYLKVNSIFPNQLSIICNQLNIKLLHITTDCVFSGKKGNYTEEDKHDETNMYGLSKSLGEPENCTVIRTSIIGEELNHKRSLLEWVRSNKDKEINGYVNHYWNGVTCLELSKIVHSIIKNNLYWNGVKHIFLPESVSKYELVNIINDIYKLNITVTKYKTEEQIDKTLKTIYPSFYEVKDLLEQIQELYHFNLL